MAVPTPPGERPPAAGVGSAAPPLIDVQALVDDVARARSHAPGHDADLLVADLETAYEELRVATDELLAQRDQIEGLRHSRELLRGQHQRLVSALPVATLITDQRGIVRTVNHEAAVLMGNRVAWLLGKPVLGFFSLDDRPALRTSISQQDTDSAPFRTRATVLTRQGDRIEVEVSVAVIPGLEPAVTWVLLDEPGRATLTTSARDRLPEVLVRLAALPATSESTQELLSRAATLCQVALGEDVELSISLGPPAEPVALGTTSTLAQRLDGLQMQHKTGPCIDAYDSGETVVSDDVRNDPRWTDIAPWVPGEIGAVVAVTLASGGHRLGALNVYRTRVGTDAALVDTCELLGTTVASLLHEYSLKAELRTTAADMERALASRAVIDQAKGIVMADRACSPDEAFDHLVRLASEQQLKVREVARGLVDRRSGTRSAQ